MNSSIVLILSGLSLNTLASLIMLYPYLRGYENVDDDYIVDMDHEGNYKQKKHLKGRRLGLAGFAILFIGFILQIIGIFLGL